MDQQRLDDMRGIFKGPLLHFREILLMMASLTDRNLTLALSALTELDCEKADLVESEDSEVDRLEMQVDDMVVTYLSTHGAVATICRLMLATTKISESLENIADQAVNIARRTKLLSTLPEVHLSVDLPKMGKIGLGMIRDSIDAFVNVNPDKALSVIKTDKELDHLDKAYEVELRQIMNDHPHLVAQCIHHLRVTRSLEQVGDQAKCIAEDVYFLYTARDIRHHKGAFAELESHS